MAPKNYTIPRWFVGIAMYSLPIVFTWCGWVSINIHEMCVNQRIIMKQLEQIAKNQE